MELVIYEDFLYRNFLPLVYLRPIFDLRCGILSFRERASKLYPGVALHLFLREYLAGVETQTSRLNDPEALKAGGLFLNGRALLLDTLIPLDGDDRVYLRGDDVVGFRLKDRIKDFKLEPPFGTDIFERLRDELPNEEVEVAVMRYPWELVNENRSALGRDFQLLAEEGVEGHIDAGTAVQGEERNLRVGKRSRVEAHVLLNVEKGPIYIGEDVLIRPPSTIDGPCYIGDGTLIEGAQLRQSCSIGKVCKISGELEESIFQGFSNKHHLGFIGHSWVGEWVNLGAGTTNSDLKNNYSPVKVELAGEKVETGSPTIGCFIGDHTKTGIGTLIDTGAVIGVFCNIFGGKGVTPKYIPSFSWGDGEHRAEHRLDRAIETARVVMGRRGEELTDNYRKLIEGVYTLTAGERTWGI